MSRYFLYIDESKDMLHSRIEIVVWVSRYKLTHCDRMIASLKDRHHVTMEIHGYRRRTSQIFWSDSMGEWFWDQTDIFESIHHFSFENFVESGEIWAHIYSHILDQFSSVATIYADHITLSTSDMKLLKYDMSIRWASLELLNSRMHPVIQIIDLLCGYIREENYPDILGHISIRYHKFKL